MSKLTKINIVKGKMCIKSILLATTAIVISNNTNAALVGLSDTDMDFLGTAQDGFNITLDTSTNLEWLDWSLTLSRNYNDVFAQTQGGNLDGWRYATESEFASLAASAGIPITFFDNKPGGTDPGFNLLNGFLGSGEPGSSIAISAISLSDNTHSLGGFNSVQDVYDVPNATPVILNPEFSDTMSLSSVGSALVRVVPVPAAMWLFGSGLLGLIVVARREVDA